MTTVNCYQITITQSPPQIIEPMIDILHKDIFNRTNKKQFIIRRRTYSPDRKTIDKAMQENSPIKEVLERAF